MKLMVMILVSIIVILFMSFAILLKNMKPASSTSKCNTGIDKSPSADSGGGCMACGKHDICSYTES